MGHSDITKIEHVKSRLLTWQGKDEVFLELRVPRPPRTVILDSVVGSF